MQEPQIFDVRLSFVSACGVRPFGPLFEPGICDIALNNTIDRKKKEVSPGSRSFLMWKKVCQKVSNPTDVGRRHNFRLSCAKALRATLPWSNSLRVMGFITNP